MQNIQVKRIISLGFVTLTLFVAAFVASNTDIKHLIDQKASEGLPVTDYSTNNNGTNTTSASPQSQLNTNGYTQDVVTNTVADVNRPGYDCSKGGCAPGVIISGYYQAPNGQFYPIGGTGNDPAAYAQTSKCVSEGGTVTGNSCQTKQQKEAIEAAAKRSCESKPDNQYINGQCLTIQTITTKEKTDDGFITSTTAIARDAAGNIVASNSIDTTTKTTTTYRETDQGTVAVQTTSIVNVNTGQILETQTNEYIVPPGTKINVNTQGGVSIKTSTGGGCKNNSDCESGLCMRNSLLQGGIYTCRPNPTPAPPARTLANQELQSTYNTLNYITGGRFENYIQAYETGEYDYRWEDLGYSSLSECKQKAGMHASQCDTKVGTKEQLAASVDLGTDITAKGALLVTGIGGLTQVAAGTAIKIAATQALTQTLAINAVQSTGNAANTCILTGASSECGQDAALATLAWANVGAVDYVANAVATGSVRALQIGRAANSAISLAGAVPTAVGAYETCQGENANAVGCTVNVVATAAQVFAAGVDGYNFVQNLNAPVSGAANEIAAVADQVTAADNLVTTNANNTAQEVTDILIPNTLDNIPATTTTVDTLLGNTETTTANILDLQFQNNLDNVITSSVPHGANNVDDIVEVIPHPPEITVNSSLNSSLADSPTVVNNFEANNFSQQLEVQNLITANQGADTAADALDNTLASSLNIDTTIPTSPQSLDDISIQNNALIDQLNSPSQTSVLTNAIETTAEQKQTLLGLEWKGFTNADGGFQFPIRKTQSPALAIQQANSQITTLDREFAQVKIDTTKLTVTKNPYPIEHFPEYDQLTYEIYLELDFRNTTQFYEQFGGQNGIPRLIGTTPEGGFITEFIPGVPLSDFKGTLTTQEIDNAILKLEKIHEFTGLTHGDLNPGNIIVSTLDDGTREINFIDFTGGNIKSQKAFEDEISFLKNQLDINVSTAELNSLVVQKSNKSLWEKYVTSPIDEFLSNRNKISEIEEAAKNWDTKINIKPDAPPTSTTTNRRLIDKYLNEIDNVDLRNAEELLAERVVQQHVSHQQFVTALEETTVPSINQIIGNEKYIVVVRPKKSNEWVFELALNKLDNLPTNVVSSEHEAIKFVNSNSDIKHIVLFDDGSYSGSQMASSVEILNKQLAGSVQIDVAIPFMTPKAEQLIVEQGAVVATHNKMLSLDQLFTPAEIEILGKGGKIDTADYYLSSRSLTTFDHKVADYVSTPNLEDRMVSRGGYIPDPIIPYDGSPQPNQFIRLYNMITTRIFESQVVVDLAITVDENIKKIFNPSNVAVQ